jgi:hypothetical protein
MKNSLPLPEIASIINIKSKKMKSFRTIIVLVFCMVFLYSTTSCAVFVVRDNGKHKGWHKNSNNPHTPFSTNPGKSKGNQK